MNLDSILEQLLFDPAGCAIVGRGSQTEFAKRFINQRTRICIDGIPSFNSDDAPSPRALYLLCATPSEEAMNTLLSRGIEKERVVFFSQLKNQIEIAHREGDVLLCGLSPLHTDEQEALWESESDLRCVKWMTGCIEQIEHLALSEPKPSCTQVKSIEILSSSYLEFRKHWAGIHPQVYKRFLFPSPGRCGGYSITRALRFHPSLNLRVDHEGNATLIYRLLLLHNRGWISETPLVAILSSMLDEKDCLGGNPICFLMPLLERIPWFKYYLLKVKRPLEQHLESIIDRNFHYTEHDNRPERSTAADWGEMSALDWDKQALSEKATWYIRKVEDQIEKANTHYHSKIEIDLNEIHNGINSILKEIGWKNLEDFPHINTLPKDRIYSMEERMQLFEVEYRKTIKE